MNIRNAVCAISLLGCIVLISCAKEYSFEGGSRTISFIAKGSLLDSLRNCRNIVVNGTYVKDTALASNEYLIVQANITAIGKYAMYTDTINGIWFRDTGTVTKTGLQTFTLKGYGVPQSPLSAGFTIRFDTSACHFLIPAAKAVYTFNALPGNCPVITVNGPYHVGANLGGADSINIPVTVKQPGSYTIATDSVNGMVFSSTGIFLDKGNYSVTLVGRGRPFTYGITTMPISVAGTPCSFPVHVALDTTMYWQCTVEGITYKGLLDSAYGTVPDTGFVQLGKRIFASGGGGGDVNNAITNYTFGFSISRINNPISPGLYYPCDDLVSCDYSCYFQLTTNITPTTTGTFYFTRKSLGAFKVTLINYDKVTKLIEGTFSGLMYKNTRFSADSTTPSFQVTNGYFRNYMAY